jgi:hypothetical protein
VLTWGSSSPQPSVGIENTMSGFFRSEQFIFLKREAIPGIPAVMAWCHYRRQRQWIFKNRIL